MNKNECRAEAAKLAQEARSKIEGVAIDAANYAEVSAEFDRIIAESDKLAERADKLEQLEARERKFDQIVTDVANTTTTTEARSVAVDKAERAFDGYMRGNVSEHELRAMSTTVQADGGFTVPTGQMADLVKALKIYGPLNEGGPCRYINTNGGNSIPIPYLNDTANKGRQIAEGVAVATDKSLTFSQVSLGAYKFTSDMFVVSNELLTDSNIDVAAEVNNAMSERLGRALNEAFTTGNGTTGPQGLVTAATAGKTTATATAIALADLIDLEHSIDAAYRGGESVGYMFNDQTFGYLRKMTDSTGRLLWQDGYVNGAPATFNNKRYWINNDMANIATGAKTVIYGDFSKFVVRRVNSLVLKRLNELYAGSDSVGFVSFIRADSKLTDARAIRALVQA